MARSSVEDIATAGGLWLLFNKPEIGVPPAIGLLPLVGLLLWLSVHMIRRMTRDNEGVVLKLITAAWPIEALDFALEGSEG